ncbi:glycosyltransferase family 4 protein [Flavobacterium sp. 123]|uniref:MraY family glycosyltransferase n=1 Tax=Flavobacterium sp. 123 TaxID=2135627 RepID=UPI000EADFDA1|nr:glycosyltransferase family 4 protein [Flavobacterium sp. 123]RKT00002.1 UDP-N-acetylmuramyl pentapeptide phosphotransferase/UDP-N-acetylglucosamine-1-phosphate transferase [Flavobacterium sp. 123]
MQYIIVAILFVILELVYFKIADFFNIIDKPNHRSSHTTVTLRGGGIIFPVAVVVAFIMGYVSVPVLTAVVLVSIVSFIDDIYPLPTLPRFLSHLIAVLLLLFDLNLFGIEFWIIPISIVLLIGWINAFNFMDGINGITVLYAMVSLLTFGYLYQNEDQFPVFILMGISCLVFGFFNIRKKAKTFAGDVGSISMAVFLAYFMLKLIFEKQQIGYLLFFSVYGIDAIVTILYRIKNKENILQPHRSHLYQYLSNEMQWSHVSVSLLYAVIQLAINCCVILFINKGYMSPMIFLLTGLVLMAVYWRIRIKVLSIMRLKSV